MLTEAVHARLHQLSSEFSEDGAARLAEKLAKYLILLTKWQRRISLVATRDPGEIVERHIADSLAVVRHIHDDAVRLIDVGSGAGLPGAIIAIAAPHLHVVSVEPITKKLSFQRAVARELELTNYDPRNERIEQHADRDYDVAVSRATWSIPDWLEIGRTLVRPGGCVLAMEGAEQHELPEGAARHPYPLEGRTRAVIVWVPGAAPGGA